MSAKLFVRMVTFGMAVHLELEAYVVVIFLL